jgi:hypothetical protein
MLQTCPADDDVLNWGVQEMGASRRSRRSHYAAPACPHIWGRAIGSERPTFSDAAVERRKKTPAERHGPAQAGWLYRRASYSGTIFNRVDHKRRPRV